MPTMRTQSLLPHLLFSLALGVSAAVLPSSQPTVAVKNGTYSGLHLSSFNQDLFLGIPYSQPPIAPYRFLPARSINESWTGVRYATNYSNICPSAESSDLALPYGMSEDCLSINVIRSSNTKAGDRLPVLFWIHGGSYQAGSSSLPNYNLTYIVQRSMEVGSPIVAASINYRKGPWGFMYSEEIKAEGNENLAIKDAMLALRWVKENIDAFGGNPDRVTIQGESAGSFMVGQLIVAQAGKGEQLFHGAIQESGSASTGTYNTTEWYEPKFQALLNSTKCTSLACLRELPYDRIYPALKSSVLGSWYPVLDPDLFPEHPAKILSSGNYHKIPIIAGCNSDEGTDNAYLNIDTEEALRAHLVSVGNPVMTPENVDTLLRLYPFTPASTPSAYGIPFLTSISLAANPGLGLQYKREAAIVGDLYYHATLLHDAALYAKHSTSAAPFFSYRFDTLPWNFATRSTQTYARAVNASGAVYSNTSSLTPSYKGVAHFSETPFVFNNPAYYGPEPEYEELARTMSAMWVHFVNHGRPTPAGHGVAGGNVTGAERQTVNWRTYFEPSENGKEAEYGDLVGRQLVFRTKSRGGPVLEGNSYRLAGRQFFLQKYKEVYGE